MEKRCVLEFFYILEYGIRYHGVNNPKQSVIKVLEISTTDVHFENMLKEKKIFFMYFGNTLKENIVHCHKLYPSKMCLTNLQPSLHR
jgi:hypothetical protein